MQEENFARKQQPPDNLPLQPTPPPQPPRESPLQRPQAPPFRPEQKRTFLERGEVRTMQKDTVRTREEEARSEQQRIAQLKAQRDREREREAVQRIRTAAAETKKKEEEQHAQELRRIQSSILPPGEERRVRDLPSPPSRGKKVFVRAVIIVIFAFIAFNLALFALWFFFLRDQQSSFQLPEFSFPQISLPFLSPSPQPAPSPQPTPQPTPPGPTPPPPSPQPVPSVSSLLQPAHTSTLQFSSSNSLLALLSQSVNAEQTAGFTELLFRKKPENTVFANANELFAFLELSFPASVTEHLQNDAFFFLYSYERGNRFGLITKVSSAQNALQALAAWEPQAEQSITPLLSFWGGKGSGYTKSFRSALHEGVPLRFQTFSLQDTGIVYAFIEDYLILASSYEATTAAIDRLQAGISRASRSLAATETSLLSNARANLSFEQQLGQVLMIGFNDASLTPELEDLLKRLRPGGVLLLGRNIKSKEQLSQLTEDLQRVSLEYSSLPLFIAVDQEGGDISRIAFATEKTAQATIEDEQHAYVVGKERGEELLSLGVNLNLSPVLDITNPDDFLFHRTFQTEAAQTGELAKALLQGQKDAGILSTTKHFPGYGDIDFNPERQLATVQELPDISPFQLALQANPEFLLTSNVVYADFDPHSPFVFSPKADSLIRSDLHFQGIILTDDLNQPSLLNAYGLETIATAPLLTGTNMVMFSKESYAKEAYRILQNLSAADPALKARIENSAARIVQLKKAFSRILISQNNENS